MNILYVTNTLHKGGAEKHLLDMAKGLQNYGVKSEVAFLRSRVSGGSVDLRNDFEKAGIKTHYLGGEHSCDPRIGIRLHRLLGKKKWDLLHSHLPRADAAALWCKLFSFKKMPWISTIHHPYDNAYSAAQMIPLLAPIWRRADGIIAVSEPVKNWSIKRLGVLPDMVHTIVHGIDIDTKIGSSRQKTGPASSRNKFCIGSIGRYEERKGHQTLIRAMPYVIKVFPDAELKIAGHDPWGYGKNLKKLISELRLEKHVRLVGYITDKIKFFSELDIFAFASLKEGFGIVVLEAMAEAKAVVVSNISPLKDIISPGVSGLVAEQCPKDFAKVIISLFKNPNYMHRIGIEGAKRVETEFSKTKMLQKTLQYYNKILKTNVNSGNIK